MPTRGRWPGSFTLSGSFRGSKPLAKHLQLTVREWLHGAESLVYTGSLAGLHAVKLGVIGPGHARTFQFSVTFRSDASNPLQGLRTTADFTWTAVQAC